MSAETKGVEQVASAQTTDKQTSEKENFIALRKKTERAEFIAEQERIKSHQLEQEILELRKQKAKPQDDDDEDASDEPYVDRKKFKKELSKLEEKIERRAEEKARNLFEQENKKNFMYRLKSEYPDLDQVLTAEAAEKLEQVNPRMAAKILAIQDEGEKREMAYHAIKLAGLHKKPEPDTSVKDKVQQNMRNGSMYYHPATAGHGGAQMGDFSETGKANAYKQMRDLMKRPLGNR